MLVLAAAALWGTTGTAQVFGGVADPVAVGAARLAVGGFALVLVALACHGPGSLAACLERLSRWWVGSTVLAVVGCVVLVSAGQSGAASVQPAGVALAVLAGACYGLYTCGAKALLERQVPVAVAMGATLGAGALLLMPVLVVGGLRLVGVRPLLMVGWLGLVTTAAAYLLFARGLRLLPTGMVGTLSLAEPLTAAALGLLVLGERPAPQAALGALSLLAGLLLAALGPVHTVPSAVTLRGTELDEETP